MKKRKTIFSIVTPSFNQGQFIQETIQSVLSQEGDFYIDYTIVDGGSDDESVEIIEKYEKFLKNDCEIEENNGLKYFVNKERDFAWNRCLGISYRWKSEKDEGQSDAINKGLKTACGDIFSFINSDDVYCPHALSRIAGVNWRNKDFVYGNGMWFDENGNDLISYPTYKPTKYSFYYQCTLCQPTVFFRNGVFRKLGEFSLEYMSFDYEYWLRALFQGHKFSFVNSILAKSRMYQQNKTLSGQQTVHNEVQELKRKYYIESEVNLNPLLLRLHKYLIHNPTARRVDELHRLLAGLK
ncbi:MAG: glycosyltransferase [Deltaproteobacteria bacterium]|nr:glycosyltransferase [Deltaproteobacteria bacterium]